MPCNAIPARHVNDKPYHIMFSSRSDWSTVPMHHDRMCSVGYTNVSKMEKCTVAGVCWPDEHVRYSWSLGNFSTIFLAEVFAILMCCTVFIGKFYRSRCIHICLDSQAALLCAGIYLSHCLGMLFFALSTLWVHVFTSAWIAKPFFLLCAGIYLSHCV